MTFSLQKLKPWMLPIAMMCGILFHGAMDVVQPIAPVLIFAMLFITFCRIRPSEFRISGLTCAVTAVQVVGAVAIYLLLLPFSADLAQGMMICVLCPTATAAPVITAMLGGSIATLVTISLTSNLAASVAAPAMFALIDASGAGSISFADTFIAILCKVGPLIIAPIIAAFLLLRFAPKAHKSIAEHQSLSFYIWAVSLIIVVGRAVSFAMAEPADRLPEMIVLALGAGVVCVLQFWAGRRIGARFADKVAGAQGLGQKNTVLAVWMATTFLNPITSIAPAAYIFWQNTINSLQIYLKNK